MKKMMLITGIGLAMVTSALAQSGPGPGTNDPINYDHEYLWGATNVCVSNGVPNEWSNQNSHSYAGQSAAGGGGNVQNRFGKELPEDVEALVQDFQRDREKLMTQLKECSDEQRQDMLKEMEQLRLQLCDRIEGLREQAHQQAEQMRTRLKNDMDPVMNAGAGQQNGGLGR